MKIYFYIFIFIQLLACKSKVSLPPDQFINYINSNESNLKEEKEMVSVLFIAKMLTPEYLAAKALRESNVSKEEYNEQLAYYKDKINFNFIIRDNQGKGQNKVINMLSKDEQYASYLGYANTKLKDDFKLIVGADTIYCAMVHMEAANSVSPSIRITIGFKGIKSIQENDITLIYEDNLFNNGPMKFYFSNGTLKNIPSINF
ncbi:MAG: hypothetical protein ACK5QC_09230 [Bacteroidota bacterium]